jgi:hypothetical protein
MWDAALMTLLTTYTDIHPFEKSVHFVAGSSWTGQSELCPTLTTKLSVAGVLNLALRALHDSCPPER